jgi:hypothetical protein
MGKMPTPRQGDFSDTLTDAADRWQQGFVPIADP